MRQIRRDFDRNYVDAFERYRIVTVANCVTLLALHLSGTEHTGVYCKTNVCWVIIGDVSDECWCQNISHVTAWKNSLSTLVFCSIQI